MEQINNFNQYSNQSFKYGVTKYTHLTKNEFKAIMLVNFNKRNSTSINRSIRSVRGSFFDFISNIFNPVPNAFSWISKGLVTSVKYQANCGGCYAFAIVKL